jgi:hypothetical protein
MTSPPEIEAETDAPDARRALLAVRPNPAERLDYRVTLTADLAAGALVLDYVPDRVVLDPAAVARYAAMLEAETWPGLEALGVAILDDVNNEAVPRWLRVTLRAGGQTVTLIDRQPGWSDRLGLSGPAAEPGRGG